MKKLIVVASFLLAQNAFGLVADLINNDCGRNLIDIQAYARQNRNTIVDELTKLDKEHLSASERKWLFRLVILGGIHVKDEVINQILGMKYREVSRLVHNSILANPKKFSSEYVWAFPSEMATFPFHQFHKIFGNIPINEGQTVVDIGAGFGRLGIYLGIIRPGVKFIGYELVPERVVEFKRVAAALELDEDVTMIEQDLSDPNFQLALADYYYSWNPVNSNTGKKLWSDLSEKGRTHAFSYVYYGLAGGDPMKLGFVGDFRHSYILDSAFKADQRVIPSAKQN